MYLQPSKHRKEFSSTCMCITLFSFCLCDKMADGFDIMDFKDCTPLVNDVEWDEILEP